ncbi:MFS transporter [Saccharomonospora saliphila]|uniref:MFS transporter n=1 Tax=Saccharomonospora saliphila TaxID=369829 RepID=UPI00048EE6B0|nr:MFS transporter [Saccharomonospora saliphila]
MTTVESSAPPPPSAPSERASWQAWSRVAAVAVGIFAMVTAEQLPVGLLTSVGSELAVSAGTVGLTVTVPGVVAAIAAPVIPLAVGTLDRRVLLVALVALLALANLVSALASSFPVLLTARVLVGMTIGGFWAIAGSVATRLVPPHQVARATTVIFSGVAAANVFGVPVGTVLGDLAGWRTAFAVLGALSALVLVSLTLLLPRLPATEPVRGRQLLRQLRHRPVLAGVIATFLLVTGHFAAYTFVSPALQMISGIPGGAIGALLLAYGAAGIVGNFGAGIAAGRSVRRTVLAISLVLALVLVLFPVLGGTTSAGITLLVLWGLAFGGVSVSLQTWMLKAAPADTEAASALWVSMFNLSIALGALAGGTVVDASSPAGALWLAGGLVALTLLAVRSTRGARLD